MPNLNEGVLRRLPLLLPPSGEQRAIGHMLSTLDDKIELNRRMNETLEAMAQAVFKSWFLDGSVAGSPKAWRSAPLPEAIEINPTRPLRKGEVAPYVDMSNLPTRGHCALNVTNRKFGSGMRFKNGDTLLARITPCLENGKTAFVDWLEDEQVGWGSTEYIVLRPKPPLPPEFGYYLARSEELRSYAIQKMTGTSGRQRVPAACFEQFEVAVPPEPLAKRFGEIAHKHMALIRANDEQNGTLSTLRDSVLPKLLSGEVRLKPQTESSQEMSYA
jgi:type I restriction enzyme S subunit